MYKCYIYLSYDCKPHFVILHGSFILKGTFESFISFTKLFMSSMARRSCAY